MKKFLGILILIIAMQLAKSQCTAFLGPDKQYMPCSNPFALNTDSIFQEPPTTTFQQQQLPAFDTIFGVGGAIDTLIPLTTKVMYTATRADGCTDVCIVGVAIRRWPIPNLGPDTCLNLGFQQETMDISSIFGNITFISGYNHHIWSTPTPQDVDTGFYSLKVVTHDGCSDVVNICVRCAVKKDTVVLKCETEEADGKYNLTTLFVKSGYTNLWKRIRFPQGDTIIYPTPAAADSGRYLLFSSKPGRCTDTMFVKVENRPRLQLGPDRKAVKCFGSTLDATREFILTGLGTQWNIPDATKANIGNHRLIATNSFGCKDTAFIEIRDTAKPEIGPDQFEFICPTDNPINLNSNFILTNLFAEWNTANPTAMQAAGTYQLIVQNEFGCKDSANFTIFHFDKPDFLRDTTITLCFGHTKDLNTIYTIPNGYSFVDWSTATPSTAGAGQHIITVSDNNQGCNFTAVVTIIVQPNDAGQLAFCHYTQSSTGGTFTTNHFRTINVDKRGHIWAGSENGGLYRFTPLNGTACGGTWQKNIPSSGITAGINRYKDIQISNIIGDTSIWAASQGHSHPQDITGGIDHVTDLNAPIQHYGSVNVPMSTQLGSRNVNSLTIGNSGKIYAALGQSIQNDTSANGGGTFIILEGGFYHNDLTNLASDFTKFLPNQPLNDLRVTAAGKRGENKIWFNVDKSCDPIGGCSNPYILEILDSTNLVTNIWNEFNSVIPTARPGLLVTAIFTASDGRTYVGMNDSVGIAVLEPEEPGTTPNWTLVNTDNSPLPYNARINFNAISEVNGEIWFGTSRGLLVYNGVGSLTECASYTLYTTANGLPSNNITDVVFDTNTFDVWLTTDNGIVRIIVDPRITGTVYNVNAGKYDALLPVLNKTGLKNAEVKLIQTSGQLAGVVLDTKNTDSTGYFEFANVKPFTSYAVEVRYTGNQNYYYEYASLKYNSALGEILIPDSLRSEMDTLKLKLEKNRFDFELYGYKFDTIILIDELLRIADGYLLEKYRDPFNFIDTSKIKEDHNKRVNNIANYYLVLANIYRMGLKASDYKMKQYGAFLDGIQSLGAFTKLGANLNYHSRFGGEANKKSAFLRATFQLLAIKLKSTVNDLLTSISTADPDWKKSVDEYSPYLNSAMDMLVNVIVNGDAGTVVNEFIEVVKKSLVVFLGKKDYTGFCREFHKDIIKNIAQHATYLNNDLQYQDVFKLVNKEVPANGENRSLIKVVIDTAAYYDTLINQLTGNAKLADAIQGVLGTAAALAPVIGATAGAFFGGAGAIPGGAIGTAVAEILVIAQKAVQLFNSAFLFKAAYRGWEANKVIRQHSKYVVPTSGFSILAPNNEAEMQSNSIGYQMHLLANLDSLVAVKNRYNQSITSLNALHFMPYDSLAYYNAFNQFVTIDSQYTKEIEASLNSIWPVAKNASDNISGYSVKLDSAINVHLLDQVSARQSFNLGCYAYQSAPAYSGLVSRMDSICTQIKIKNNTTTAALQELVNLANNNNITAPAYLVQTNYQLLFSNRRDSAGSVIYTLKNIGNVAQINVTAQILQPTGGFNITSVPFINLGTISPGQSKQITFDFIAPQADTSGDYDIIIKADNGIFTNLRGTLITLPETEVTSITNGLWSNPETWSTGRVPNASSKVTILHNVDVDTTTAECESIKAITPGLLKVKAGMKLSVLK